MEFLERKPLAQSCARLRLLLQTFDRVVARISPSTPRRSRRRWSGVGSTLYRLARRADRSVALECVLSRVARLHRLADLACERPVALAVRGAGLGQTAEVH